MCSNWGTDPFLVKFAGKRVDFVLEPRTIRIAFTSETEYSVTSLGRAYAYYNNNMLMRNVRHGTDGKNNVPLAYTIHVQLCPCVFGFFNWDQTSVDESRLFGRVYIMPRSKLDFFRSAAIVKIQHEFTYFFECYKVPGRPRSNVQRDSSFKINYAVLKRRSCSNAQLRNRRIFITNVFKILRLKYDTNRVYT